MAPMKSQWDFCYKYLFSDELLASKVSSMVQQPINSCIVNSSNFVPSTSNVIMSKDHESIVITLQNKYEKIQYVNVWMYM
jgi:P pilus assembly chaperone PapD